MKHPLQEPDLVPSNAVVAAILGVIVAIVVGCVIAHGIVAWRTAELHGDASAPAERLRGVPPEVVPPDVNAMETLPFSVEALGLASHQVAEDWLASYGWVDRGRRTVHVPIDVALDTYLVTQQLPGRAPRRGGAP
ncbi:MAG TPA: hypothetical protein VHW23_15030 [Kofleriaceae bacterium]|jgi:hypothetical protein|nr:hypothetical protein [Kofleriaceae bacterium]